MVWATQRPKPVRREALIDGSQAVAKRQQANDQLRGFEKNSGYHSRGAANPRGRGGRGGPAGNPLVWKRGFRGRGWMGGGEGALISPPPYDDFCFFWFFNSYFRVYY
jgi:hypothetical protein